jgi:hypothetical protein
MALSSRRVYHTEPRPQGTHGIPADGWIRAFSGGEWVAGEMAGQHGSYVMLVNRNPHRFQQARISWAPDVNAVYRVSKRNLMLEPVKLKRAKSGNQEAIVKMDAGAGELFYLDLKR